MKTLANIDTDTCLTTAEFALAVGSSADTVKKYCQRKVILALKAGHSWLIPKTEINRFKKTRKKPGRPSGRKSA